MGDITGDLSAKRGQVNGTQALPGGGMAVSGQVPLSELANYQARLNGMTGGQGRYTIALSHYEAVPLSAQAALMSQYKVKDED
jgi:elongation factor G